MSKAALRKQSLMGVPNASAASTTPSTPWDTQTRPSVPDFSTYLNQAKSLCPHLITDTTPPSPPAAELASHSTAAQLLRLTRLQAEWEERQLAAYQKQISDEHAALVSSQWLIEQRDTQQRLLSHLHALMAEGAESSLAAHVQRAASFPSASLNGLTSEQQASANTQSSHLDLTYEHGQLCCLSHRYNHQAPPSLIQCCVRAAGLLCQCCCVCHDSRMRRVGRVAFHRHITPIGRRTYAASTSTAGQPKQQQTPATCRQQSAQAVQ